MHVPRYGCAHIGLFCVLEDIVKGRMREMTSAQAMWETAFLPCSRLVIRARAYVVERLSICVEPSLSQAAVTTAHNAHVNVK